MDIAHIAGDQVNGAREAGQQISNWTGATDVKDVNDSNAILVDMKNIRK